MTDFDKYDATISEEQVKNYLLSWKLKGFQVMVGRPTVKGGWSVEFGQGEWIGVQPHQGSKAFWCISNLLGRITGPKGTIEELKISFEDACKYLKVNPNIAPNQHHTSAKAPFSVWIQLNAMVNLGVIKAIYDPYLDDKTLVNLLGLWSIGTRFDQSLKLLACQKSVMLNMLTKFNTEIGINAKMRITLFKDHPRLIFLNDGRCLSPDFSLNKEQNGTINTIESAPKQVIFDETWDRATPLDS